MTDFEGQEEQLPYPTLAPVIFHCLKQTTRLRNWCLQVAYSPWLDYLSVAMILFSCVNMPGDMKSTVQEIVDALIFVYFVVEMLIKMMALGVFGYKGSYFSNNWYKLDFIINCGEMLDYIFETFLQFCQVLSPLRLISRVPSKSTFQHFALVLKTYFSVFPNVLPTVSAICSHFNIDNYMYNSLEALADTSGFLATGLFEASSPNPP
ncbi:voltage-dependent T-type calcium channel subunit alpha-1H-like [Sander lucioperca]|uniref:voltage-dependent T-type calcium channel subunit alpha-1H-like n=1 Tax=Sander lucioperca TaxID=283035 RepID=UPI001653D0D1|nr:voltage-dependent T-type calcium channel subunit alpha-1H-like [Sander lucioperca]